MKIYISTDGLEWQEVEGVRVQANDTMLFNFTDEGLIIDRLDGDETACIFEDDLDSLLFYSRFYVQE